jgi:hypothetical protein
MKKDKKLKSVRLMILLVIVLICQSSMSACSTNKKKNDTNEGAEQSSTNLSNGETPTPGNEEGMKKDDNDINAENDDKEKTDEIIYENTQYGFQFKLPETWEGYTIITDEWEADSMTESGKTEKGSMVSIRHPEWSEEDPRQDVPIMIFTLDQWNSLQSGKIHIGAAPIDPEELGRNSVYVFALPARYNYSYYTGYEEVEEILNKNSLKPMEDFIEN